VELKPPIHNYPCTTHFRVIVKWNTLEHLESGCAVENLNLAVESMADSTYATSPSCSTYTLVILSVVVVIILPGPLPLFHSTLCIVEPKN